MKIIPIDDIRDGMVLHKAAIATNDLVLIPGGTELVYEYHHEILARWAIDTIQIEEKETNYQLDDLPEEVKKKIQLKLNLLYVNSDQDSPIAAILKEKTSKLLIKEAMKQGNHAAS